MISFTNCTELLNDYSGSEKKKKMDIIKQKDLNLINKINFIDDEIDNDSMESCSYINNNEIENTKWFVLNNIIFNKD